MKKFNKLTLLAGLAATATAMTPIVATSCHKPETKQTAKITWADGWYAYEAKSSGGSMKTNSCDVKFTLQNALADGQNLTFEIEVIDKTGSVTLESGSLSIGADKKTVTIPMYLKTSWQIMRFGWYASYNITFKCSNDTSIVWTQKVKDCYLYLLTSFYNDPTVSFSGEIEHVGDLEFRTTDNIEPSLFDKKQLLFKCEVTETTDRPIGFENVNIVTYPGQKYPYKSEQKLYQLVTVSDTTGLTEGDTFTFKVRVTLTLAIFPDKPVSFDFENIQFKYK